MTTHAQLVTRLKNIVTIFPFPRCLCCVCMGATLPSPLELPDPNVFWVNKHDIIVTAEFEMPFVTKQHNKLNKQLRRTLHLKVLYILCNWFMSKPLDLAGNFTYHIGLDMVIDIFPVSSAQIPSVWWRDGLEPIHLTHHSSHIFHHWRGLTEQILGIHCSAYHNKIFRFDKHLFLVHHYHQKRNHKSHHLPWKSQVPLWCGNT